MTPIELQGVDGLSDEDLKLENQLCFPLYVCAREIVNAYRPFLDELGLTYTQYIALMVLWEEKKITVKALGVKLHLDSGTLTPLLKKLESKGLIVRERSSEDERSVLASITNEGMDLKKKALLIPTQMADCIEDFSIEEADLLRTLLNKLIAALRK